MAVGEQTSGKAGCLHMVCPSASSPAQPVPSQSVPLRGHATTTEPTPTAISDNLVWQALFPIALQLL